MRGRHPANSDGEHLIRLALGPDHSETEDETEDETENETEDETENETENETEDETEKTARACRLGRSARSRDVPASSRLASSRNLRRPARGVPSRQPRKPGMVHAPSAGTPCRIRWPGAAGGTRRKDVHVRPRGGGPRRTATGRGADEQFGFTGGTEASLAVPWFRGFRRNFQVRAPYGQDGRSPGFLAGGRIGFTGGTVWPARRSRGSPEPPSSEFRPGTSSRSPDPTV